jgi:hypothetical protein
MVSMSGQRHELWLVEKTGMTRRPTNQICWLGRSYSTSFKKASFAWLQVIKVSLTASHNH